MHRKVLHNDTEFSERCNVIQLTMQVVELTEQVAALAARQDTTLLQ